MAGCSSSSSADPTPSATSETPAAVAPPTAQPEEVAVSESYPLPDCTGRSPEECVYAGFDPSVDGFSFPNWGSPGTIDAAGLIALFGEAAVCAEVTDSGCVLYPAAQSWVDQVNEAMSGGHCEGMAVVSQLIYDGYLLPQTLDETATATADLLRDDPDVEDSISLWWATQMLPEVQAAFNEYKTYDPTEIALALAEGLPAKRGYTMGIYSPNGAHAITPIAVSLEGDLIAVHVYDNNYPGTVQRVMIDPAAETWSYAAGATSPGAPTDGWEGGLGTIELTPMGSRSLPGRAPFGDGKTGTTRGVTTIMATSSDPTVRTGLLLTVDGTTYDTSDPTVELPEDVTSRPLLGTTAQFGRIITLPTNGYRSVAVRLAVDPAEGDATQAPVTLSVDGRGQPRVTLQGEVPTGPSESGFDIDDGLLRLVATDAADSRVQVDNGRSSFGFPVPEGAAVEIDSVDGVAEILLVDEDGEVFGTYEVDDGGDGPVIYAEGVFDETTGLFDVTESEGVLEDVDEARTELLAGALGLDDELDDFGGDVTDGSADDGSGTDDQGAEDSGSDGSSGGDGAADDPAADEPPADDPAADEAPADDPAADDPASGE